MNFNAEIDLGNILTIVSILGGLYTFHRSNLKRIHAIEFKVTMMWQHFAKKFDLPRELEEEK